jgi:hypothetical protein
MKDRSELVMEYMFALEKKSNGQDHYQGIVWTHSKLTERQMSMFRNIKKKHWVPKVNGSRGYRPVSFTKAKNVQSLAKYCNNKEGLGLLKSDGITDEILLDIGKWIYKKGKKKQDDILKIYRKRFKEKYEIMIEDECLHFGLLGHPREPIFDNIDTLKRMMYELAYDVWMEHDMRPPRKQHIVPMLHACLRKYDYLVLQYSV